MRSKRISISSFYLSPRTKRHNHFKMWFTEWHRVLNKYESEWEGDDLPYWHTEGTNVGHLALAAYKCGGYPLQEYSTSRRKGAKGPGRADLYVGFSRKSYVIEAKQRWSSIDAEKSKGQVGKALDQASKEYRKLPRDAKSDGKGMALVFVIPRIKLANACRKNLQKLKNEMKRLEKICCADLFASHLADFKLSFKLSKKARSKENGVYYWYPGIAVIGKRLG